MPSAMHEGVAPLSPRVLEQAADWLMRLHEAPRDATLLSQWQHWHDGHPDHAHAWARAERLLGLTAQVPVPLARQALAHAAPPCRRVALRSLAVLAVAPGAGWLAWRLWEQAAWDASLRTANTQRLNQGLEDGSQLDLNVDTALDIAFDGQQRLLRLRHGEIHVSTAADQRRPARPFRVASPHGMMEALGTRFTVRVFDDTTVLNVQDGMVRVDAGEGSSRQRVDSGQQLRWGHGPLPSPVAAEPGADAWRHGMLVVDAWPLAQVLAELQRYQRGWLQADAAIAALPVSGAFPIHDLQRSVAMLQSTYPLLAERRLGGWRTRFVPR